MKAWQLCTNRSRLLYSLKIVGYEMQIAVGKIIKRMLRQSMSLLKTELDY